MNQENKCTELDEQMLSAEVEQTNMPSEDLKSAETSSEADNSAEPAQEALAEKLEKLNDTYLRLMAEYDNYRKRTLKEKSDLIRNGGEQVLRDLLPVVDDLDIAMINIEAAEDIEAVKEGIRLIHTKLVDFLMRQGIKAIPTAEAQFDEELHEAIATFPAPSEELKGKVVDCVKKGYTLHDKVLRHAHVVVGQ